MVGDIGWSLYLLVAKVYLREGSPDLGSGDDGSLLCLVGVGGGTKVHRHKGCLLVVEGLVDGGRLLFDVR